MLTRVGPLGVVEIQKEGQEPLVVNGQRLKVYWESESVGMVEHIRFLE